MKCPARIYPRGMMLSVPCGRTATVSEEGKMWCRTHAPSAVKAREEKSRVRQAEERKRLDRQWAVRTASNEVVNRAKEWRLAALGLRGDTGDLLPANALAAAVDHLLALEKGNG